MSGSVTDMATPPPTTPVDRPSLATRPTYRSLLLRGMAPEEAANLTAFLAGIPIGEAHWTLKQINQLLFLRQMKQTGHFGRGDGTPTH